MFYELWKKECKVYGRSLVYYLFVATVFLFYFFQVAPKSLSEQYAPQKGKEKTYFSYEIKEEEKKIAVLLQELRGISSRGDVLKIGNIINKTVRLSEKQLTFIKEKETQVQVLQKKIQQGRVSVEEGRKEMYRILTEIDERVGGNTSFSEKHRKQLFIRRDSYEVSMEIWEDILKYDHFTEAVGRVFADAMGIVAGFFPIFLSAFLMKRERRYHMEELIYPRSFYSYQYLLTKSAALFFMLCLPFLLVATHATLFFYLIAKRQGYPFYGFSFYKYTIGWVFPTLAFTLSFGLCLSIVTEKRIFAVLFQLFLWFGSILPLSGAYGLHKIFIRFNRIGNHRNYIGWQPAILQNRIFYSCLSLLLIIFSVILLNWKRGVVHGTNR